jgi:MEMO1 family protein
MTLIGCFVTPHPAIIVPEVGGAQLAEAHATVQAMRAVQEKAAALSPDTIVLMSPHAPISVRHMGVSLASSYEGSLAFFRAPHVSVSAAGDQELAQAMMEAAKSSGVPTISTADSREVVELDHGATVPLVYLMGGLTRPCRFVLLAFSQLDRLEHVRFGEAIGQVIVAASQRVLYVASGDLSHRLIPGAPVGFDPRGERFDRAVVDAFASGDWNGLLSINPGLIAAAGECGYRSLAVLSGVVAAARAAGLQPRNHVLSYEGPFGVGYIVGEVETMDRQRDPLVELATQAIEAYKLKGVIVEPEAIPGLEPRRAGVFVSLHLSDGSLRGCIGTIEPRQKTIEQEIVANAISAATQDPRFRPLAEAELESLDISVDVLGPAEEVSGPESLDPKVYGVIVQTVDGRQALLLPDLEGVETVDQQLRIVCRKGRIDFDHDEYRIFRFRVERHH